MAIPSLTGSYIDETFQRLVQTNNTRTEFADGLGNPITLGPPGSVNPTPNYLPFNNAGIFADSYLNQTGSILKTTYNGIDKGLSFNFLDGTYQLGEDVGITILTSSRQINIGDYQESNNATYLAINDSTQLIRSVNGGNDKGLKLDFANNSYTLGDPAGNTITVSDNGGDNASLSLLNGAVTFNADDEININSNTAVVLNAATTYIKQLTSSPQLNI
jgi:hypothetical protein